MFRLGLIMELRALYKTISMENGGHESQHLSPLMQVHNTGKFSTLSSHSPYPFKLFCPFLPDLLTTHFISKFISWFVLLAGLLVVRNILQQKWVTWYILKLGDNKQGPTVCATPITVIWPITSTVTNPIIKMGVADTMGSCLLKEGHISDTLLHGMCKPHCGNLPCYTFCYGPH